MKSLGTLGLLFVIFTGVSNAWAQTPSSTDAAEEAKQLSSTFEAKFAAVTPDLKTLSSTNLSALEAALKAHRNAMAYVSRARALAVKVDQQLVLSHATSAALALDALTNDRLLSLDEAIRQKFATPDVKTSHNTLLQTDGKIGEQDAIYFALKAPGTAQDRMEYSFGDVEFLFDKAVILNKSYFTLNSFTVGLPALALVDGTTAYNLPQLIAMYQPVVFQGYAAYQRLLVDSEINRLWLIDQPWSGAIFKDFTQRYIKNTAQTAPAADGTSTVSYGDDVKAAPLCPLLVNLSEATAANCAAYVKVADGQPELRMTAVTDAWSLTVNIDEAQQDLRQFAFFPAYAKTPWPLLARQSHWFWEVKIPRQTNLAGLRSMTYSSTLPTAAALRTAALNYAQSHHLNMKETLSIDSQSAHLEFTPQ